MSFDLVFFGGTGDLTWRKLMPALFQAFRHGKLPEGGRILAVARDDQTDERYREWLKERFREVDAGKRPSDEEFERFAALVHYRRMDLSQPEHYQGLKDWLDARNADTVVLYLATSPHLFTGICEQLGAVGLNHGKVRVVLEKPLGHDLDSAQEINRAVRSVFAEAQAFRIDHYLGKPSVQNLMALRFGNALFEPLWRREWVQDVQITIAEELGVETRGDFYDRTGALRDMVQNHLVQLLCMVAMEPPASLSEDAIRDEKIKILKALKPILPQDVAEKTVRGQYRAGAVGGKPVVSYVDEQGIAADSTTETFVAIKAEIANWRWEGVPFYLRTGKRMQSRVAEIVVHFRDVPHAIFPRPLTLSPQNRLVIRLQPEESIRLYFLVKQPGDTVELTPTSLDLDFANSFKMRRAGAYERLLLDVIRGKLGLFVRRDEQVQAWRWVEPILDTWDQSTVPPKPYTAGTWGPAASSALMSRDGALWHEEA